MSWNNKEEIGTTCTVQQWRCPTNIIANKTLWLIVVTGDEVDW